jgi:hypothetical protein
LFLELHHRFRLSENLPPEEIESLWDFIISETGLASISNTESTVVKLVQRLSGSPTLVPWAWIICRLWYIPLDIPITISANLPAENVIKASQLSSGVLALHLFRALQYLDPQKHDACLAAAHSIVKIGHICLETIESRKYLADAISLALGHLEGPKRSPKHSDIASNLTEALNALKVDLQKRSGN